MVSHAPIRSPLRKSQGRLRACRRAAHTQESREPLRSLTQYFDLNVSYHAGWLGEKERLGQLRQLAMFSD